MIIFLAIVIVIFTSVNLYIYNRSLPLFNSLAGLTVYFKVLFWFVVSTYLVGRLVERFWTNWFIDFLIRTGSFWMGFMLYLFLFFLLFDIVRLGIHILPIKSIKDLVTPEIRVVVVKVIYSFAVLLIVIGFINAQLPRANQYKFKINKALAGSIKIVAVSDVHLGTVISKSRLNRLINQINNQNPDIVLFAGDVFDEDIRPILNNGMGEKFTHIKSRLGVFAITGNHEFFGGVEKKVKYLEEHGVKVLRDSSVMVDSAFYLIGRDDRQAKFFTGKDRKSLNSLVSNLDKSKPLVLLDHQPYNLQDAASNGIDLQLSGHTHNGQLWPFNYITKAIFELSSGHLQKDDTHIIVSNGYGTWGPPIRLGSRPEVLVIELEGN